MIKKLLSITLIFVAFGFTTKTTEEAFTWETWNVGFPNAQKLNKVALIDAYTDWCGWCKKMDASTYIDEQVVAKIKKDFVPIKFNPELKGLYNVGDTTISGPELIAALSQGKSTGYPTTFFYVPRTNHMYQYPGYQSAENFIKILDAMADIQNGTAKKETVDTPKTNAE